MICIGNTNQFGTNTCHHNKKLNYIINHLHLFWDFLKSLINEYNDIIDKNKNDVGTLAQILLNLIVAIKTHKHEILILKHYWNQNWLHATSTTTNWMGCWRSTHLGLGPSLNPPTLYVGLMYWIAFIREWLLGKKGGLAKLGEVVKPPKAKGSLAQYHGAHVILGVAHVIILYSIPNQASMPNTPRPLVNWVSHFTSLPTIHVMLHLWKRAYCNGN